jgi:hypothetical protein
MICSITQPKNKNQNHNTKITNMENKSHRATSGELESHVKIGLRLRRSIAKC